MALRKFKLALNAAKFPLLYSLGSNGVVFPDLDVPQRVITDFFGQQNNKDFNVAQTMLLHNTLPTTLGYDAANLTRVLDTAVNFVSGTLPRILGKVQVLRDDDQPSALYLCKHDGVGARTVRHFIVNFGEFADWTEISSYASGLTSSQLLGVSSAYLNGRTFVCIIPSRFVEWNDATNAMDTLAITYPAGVTVADVRGNTAVQNYHMLWTKREILWSSLVDPLNFNDTVNGAGRQTPTDLRGTIVKIVPISGGFIIYSTENVVAALATNNAAAPWIFKPVDGAQGILTADQVVGAPQDNTHYMLGSAGPQKITLQRAEFFAPELLQFLGQPFRANWDTATKTIVTSSGGSPYRYGQLSLVAGRYLCFSYKSNDILTVPGNHSHCLVYDLALSRWGVLTTPHAAVFEMPQDIVANTYSSAPSRDNLWIFGDQTNFSNSPTVGTGDIIRVDLGQSDSGLSSIEPRAIVLGRLQLARSRLVTVHRLEFNAVLGGDNSTTGPTPVCRLLPNLSANDLYTRGPGVAPSSFTYSVGANSRMMRAIATFRATAHNFDIALEGNFSLTELIAEVQGHGSR